MTSRIYHCFALLILMAAAISVGSVNAASVEPGLRDATTTEAIFASPTQDPYTLAVRAYIWGMPLVDWAKVRVYQTRPDNPIVERGLRNAGAPINRFGRARALYGPESQDGVGPNNDTLYTNVWFDMEAGPFVVETPDFGDRYYTFTLYMGDTTSAQSLGQRTHGDKLPPLFLHDKNYRGEAPEGMVPVEVSTRYMLIAGRILVEDNEEDLARVHSLQDQVRARTLCDWQAGVDREPPITWQRPLTTVGVGHDEDLQFLDMLANVIADSPVSGSEGALVTSFAAIGLTPERGFDITSLTPATVDEVRRGLQDAQALVATHSRRLGVDVGGWTTNFSGGVFGDDYLLRAAVAKDQIGVSVREEAIYPIGRTDADGEPLHGDRRYRIHMPADNLPGVKGFWSITLYDDNGFMVANPIDRYSIGDRTKGLVTTAKGDLVIALQSSPPSEADVNWLPTPKAPFYMMMRLYIPDGTVLDGSWQPPAIVRLANPDH